MERHTLGRTIRVLVLAAAPFLAGCDLLGSLDTDAPPSAVVASPSPATAPPGPGLTPVARPGPGTTIEDGIVAWNRGDYENALRLIRPAATQGNAVAAHYMGLMYAEGQAVERDPTRAAASFRFAADKGYAPAQVKIAEFYTTGWGVPRDPVQAVKWYTLAADALPASQIKARDDVLARREKLTRGMNREQLMDAQRQIWDWQPK